MKLNIQININRKFIFSSSIIIFISLFYLFLTPYISLLLLNQSIKNKNYIQTNRYIDYPSVRKSIRGQLSKSITKTVTQEMKENRYMLLSLIFIKPIVNGLVEVAINSIITPEGLILLLEKGQINNESLKDKNNPEKELNGSSNLDTNKKPNINLYYKNLNLFVLENKIDNIEKPIKAYFKRDGLSKWRLFSIKIPEEIIRF